jgi:hypothetical protein
VDLRAQRREILHLTGLELRLLELPVSTGAGSDGILAGLGFIPCRGKIILLALGPGRFWCLSSLYPKYNGAL